MKRINRFLVAVAGVVLILAMVLAVLNMALRPLGRPIDGSFELMGFASALIASLGLGYAQQEGSNISVDLLFSRLPRGVGKALEAFSLLVCSSFLVAVAVKVGFNALDMRGNGEVSETLGIPFYPVVVVVALGLSALGATLFAQFVRLLLDRRGAR